MLPLSLRRQSRRALYVGLLVVMVAGVAAALVPVGPAVARPRRADLAVTGMVAGPAQVLMGEIVGIGVTVANVGTRVADTVTVYVTLPPTLQPPSQEGRASPGAAMLSRRAGGVSMERWRPVRSPTSCRSTARSSVGRQGMC
jgi:hypothetical protein